MKHTNIPIQRRRFHVNFGEGGQDHNLIEEN